MEPTAGDAVILIVGEFRELPEDALNNAYVRGPNNMASDEALADHAKEVGSVNGLEYMSSQGGRHLILQDGQILNRKKLYAIAPVGWALNAAGRIALRIAGNGPGRWWSTGSAVMYVGSNGEQLRRAFVLDGVEHITLAAYYFFDPVAP